MYLIGLDNGGTSTKAAVFDVNGNEVATAGRHTKLITPKPGYTERDMEELWLANCACVREALEKAGITFDDVISIEISDETIMERMSGRRVCEHCGASYHLVAVPPKTPGVCDKCGGKLIQRHDDEPETVKARLEVYHKETEPLKDFYAERGLLKSVENQPTVAETSQAILHVLGR